MYFLDITRKSIIGDNDCTELRALLMLMFVYRSWFLHLSINKYPQHFGRFYIISYLRDGQSYKSLCCSHLVHLFTVWRKKTFLIHITVKKLCWFWFCSTYSLRQYTGEFTIHSNVLYAYNALLSRIPCNNNIPVIIWPYHILYSGN